MKFELELSEEEIRTALQDKVQRAVRAKVSEWSIESHIKDRINHFWRDEVDRLVLAAMADHEGLKQKIAAAMEKRLRSQLHKAMSAHDDAQL